ncbi:MAG: hypothetical protein ACK5MU_03825 [Candidatus Saccharimonadales bacterium]
MKKVGLGLIALGIVALVIVKTAETAIVIGLGIRVFSILSIVPYIAVAAGIVATGVGIIPTVRARLAKSAEDRRIEQEKMAESKSTLSYSAKTYDPADIRRMLIKLKEQRPDLASEIDKCESQMDSMDHRQERLKNLLDLNEADYLRNTEELLNEVEQFICKNFRKVINRGIVSEMDDDAVFAGDEKYSTHVELIQAVLKSNQVELDNIKKFLADLADLISEQNDNSQTTLEAWMKVIRDSLKKEEISL